MSRRVAFISDHASPLATLGGVDAGGQNVYVAQLARQLAALGDQVDIYTRRDSQDQPEVVEWLPGIRVIHVPAGPAEPLPKEQLLPHMGAFRDWMLRRLRSSRYDVVHAHFFMSGLVAAEIKAALGIPFVITFHALGKVRRQFQGADDEFTDDRFAIEERVVDEADGLIAECPQDEEDLIRLYNADPARITIVPAGFDPSEFEPSSRPLARLDLGLDPSERILLQLGRMVPRKGVDNAIRALGILVHEHELPARLLIVGGSDREPDLEAHPELRRLAGIAREAKVEDRVTFVGRRDRDELAAYYNAADVFISTPWYEPFGITPLEAMACGTPVLGSNVGGIKFSVRDGETGYLVPPNDPAALAERAAHLYRHPKLLAVFGRQAIRRVTDLFTWERVAASVASVYDEVLVTLRLARNDEAERLAAVDRRFDDLIGVLRTARHRLRNPVLEASDLITSVLARDKKVLVVGNGGSAAEAQHLAAEFVGRFRIPGRPGLPMIALGTDAAVLSAWANDFSWEDALARQVEALGRPGDLLIGLSTSGTSTNVVRAFERAKERGLRTLAFTGGDGGLLRGLAEQSIVVPSRDTQHIQEVHGLLVHLVSEFAERRLVDAGWFGDAMPAAGPAPVIPSVRRGRDDDAERSDTERDAERTDAERNRRRRRAAVPTSRSVRVGSTHAMEERR